MCLSRSWIISSATNGRTSTECCSNWIDSKPIRLSLAYSTQSANNSRYIYLMKSWARLRSLTVTPSKPKTMKTPYTCWTIQTSQLEYNFTRTPLPSWRTNLSRVVQFQNIILRIWKEAKDTVLFHKINQKRMPSTTQCIQLTRPWEWLKIITSRRMRERLLSYHFFSSKWVQLYLVKAAMTRAGSRSQNW